MATMENSDPETVTTQLENLIALNSNDQGMKQVCETYF